MQPWLWLWLLAFPVLLAFASLAGVIGAKAPRDTADRKSA